VCRSGVVVFSEDSDVVGYCWRFGINLGQGGIPCFFDNFGIT
jgi:hypothetical protein